MVQYSFIQLCLAGNNVLSEDLYFFFHYFECFSLNLFLKQWNFFLDICLFIEKTETILTLATLYPFWLQLLLWFGISHLKLSVQNLARFFNVKSKGCSVEQKVLMVFDTDELCLPNKSILTFFALLSLFLKVFLHSCCTLLPLSSFSQSNWTLILLNFNQLIARRIL